MVSVVIPAHDEEAVIGAGLGRLLAGTAPGEFDVVVVANACSDGTAKVAERAGVRVIETPVPGKANALRLGDAACRTFPRVYLDADVELTAESVRRLVAACGRPGVLACAPVPVLDLGGAGRVARRLHHVHEQLIAPVRSLAGVGVYVLNEEGHGRVFPLPDLISDDGWVQGSFTAGERVVVREATSTVRPARTVAAHLDRRVRVRRGNRQLVALGRPAAGSRLRLGSLGALLRRRRVSPLDAACYLAVLALDRVVTRFRTLRGDQVGWGRDAGSRADQHG
ncbi:glycosyltransferase [Streptosporangium soli]|nr:glycosyltransferase [Streptosporangium sp. KLBMP 9127]